MAAGFLLLLWYTIIIKVLIHLFMEENIRDEQKKVVDIQTKSKIGLGVKVVVTVVILGAIAAGVYAALAMSG